MHFFTFEVLFVIGFIITFIVDCMTLYYMFRFLVDIEINFFGKGLDYEPDLVLFNEKI
jgi:hypothetical protein